MMATTQAAHGQAKSAVHPGLWRCCGSPPLGELHLRSRCTASPPLHGGHTTGLHTRHILHLLHGWQPRCSPLRSTRKGRQPLRSAAGPPRGAECNSISPVVPGTVHECCEGNDSPPFGGRHGRRPPTPAVDGPALQDQALPCQAGEGRLHPGIRQPGLAAGHPDALRAVQGAVLERTEAGQGQEQSHSLHPFPPPTCPG